jgi:hypothetical protein
VRYDKTIVVRCSGKLKRTIDQWSRREGVKPAVVARRVLEAAFQVEQQDIGLPPGVKPIKPTQKTPKKT